MRALPFVLAGALLGAPCTPAPAQEPSGRELYRATCANCHGADGTGAPPTQVGFAVPIPDFTDCNFASREPDADWLAVAHEGGPARGFSPMMPAFGDALSDEEAQRVMDYVRTLCADRAWPRGELNLPRPMFTEKAYPEDEAVLTVDAAAEGPGEVANEIIYEQRVGPRGMVEVVVPFSWREREQGSGWRGGSLGDVALGYKHAVWHDLRRGSILSLAGEVILPTGDEDAGFGKGTVVLEPFVAFGQILPAESFVQVQGGLELPVDRDRGPDEAFWRGALGITFTEGRWGRAWTPMVEVLGARAFEDGARTEWDLAPQFQVTLNTRQHVMANVAVRLPLTDAAERPTRVLVYLLWDWFDGGLGQGW